MVDETQEQGAIERSPAGPVGEGAAEGAPTAPHATSGMAAGPGARKKRKATGPERFWRKRGLSALMLAAFASIGIHYALSPFALLPAGGLEVKDQAGDLAIPVDIFNETPEPPPEPAAPPPVPVDPKAAAEAAEAKAAEATRAALDGGLRDGALDASEDAAPRDAGPSFGGAEHDAAGHERDAAARPARDAGETEAGADAGELGGAHVSPVSGASSGVSGNGPRDPSAILGGAASSVQAGPQNVMVVLNMDVIRKNPVGARLGPLLGAAPQWRDFLAGTGIDPVRDGDWFLLFGPSLVATERDAIVIKFNVSDGRAAKALEAISKHDVGGGAFDTGVPGVKAWHGRADRAPRVFMIPRPHMAVVVPPDYAPKAAQAFAKGSLEPKLVSGEAVRGIFKNPHGSVPAIPEAVSQLRVMVVPQANGDVDLRFEGDCTDAASAAEAAASLRRTVRAQNSLMVQAVSRGVLNSFETSSDGSMARAKLHVTEDQLEALYELGAAFLNVDVPPIAPGGAGGGAGGSGGPANPSRGGSH